jgi:hypothetical protein
LGYSIAVIREVVKSGFVQKSYEDCGVCWTKSAYIIKK